MNGNLIEGRHLRKAGTKKWQAKHSDFFKVIMKMMENFGMEVMKWHVQLEDMGNTFLLLANRFYNFFRALPSKPYYSLSQAIKQKVKSAVSYISNFEKVVEEFFRTRKVDGIIYGHIHHFGNTHRNEIHYLNSDDWVENILALTEDIDGNWNIVVYCNVPADESERNQEFIIINTAS